MFVGDEHILTKIDVAEFEKEIQLQISNASSKIR